jgi:hypothetical protein
MKKRRKKRGQSSNQNCRHSVVFRVRVGGDTGTNIDHNNTLKLGQKREEKCFKKEGRERKKKPKEEEARKERKERS